MGIRPYGFRPHEIEAILCGTRERMTIIHHVYSRHFIHSFTCKYYSWKFLLQCIKTFADNGNVAIFKIICIRLLALNGQKAVQSEKSIILAKILHCLTSFQAPLKK